MVLAFGDKGRHARTTWRRLAAGGRVRRGRGIVRSLLRSRSIRGARTGLANGAAGGPPRLHDASRGIIENMPAAAEAAVAGNFSIECDIQLTADGEAMVHHDDALGRLTEAMARCSARPRPSSSRHVQGTSERMMALADLCALVAGRVAIMIE